MDTWSHTQVLSMLEGGNEQLKRFFERHEMGNDSKMAPVRYKTKAALFYRANLQKHVESVAAAGVYRGREAVRRTHLAKQKMLVTTGSCCTPKASSSTNGTTSVSGKSKKQIIAAA